MKSLEIIFRENPKKKTIRISDFDIWHQRGSMIITNRKDKSNIHISSVRLSEMNTSNWFDCMKFNGYYKEPGKGYFPIEIKIALNIH